MNIAVIFAGGVGSRMNSKKALPKQFLCMHGKPIIIHTLEHFEDHEEIDAIVIACVKEWIAYMEDLVKKYNISKVCKIVPGGETGQMSIYNGLCAAEEIADDESIVLIHDGVRPLINSKLISDSVRTVREHGSAITSVHVKETVLMVKNENENRIDYVPDRANTRLARAPQSFWLREILQAQRKAISEGKTEFIDSCSLMQYFGKELFLIDGPMENIKITTPDDFYTMRALLDAKENAQIYGLEDE